MNGPAKPIHRRRPRARLEPGHVWLAGAGPGDPGCLTLDVADALAQAEVVVYDALVDAAVLDMAEGAERVFAGKRGGKPSATQADITARLIALARAGRRVVRLKGGDPYVFGRGGEEARALAAAGIPFRVLPGVSSAFAAGAAAGIPATMRGINKAVVLATGHAVGADDDLDWAALAATGQPIIVYMGLKNLPGIAERLIAGGLAAATPAAAIAAATTPDQRVVVATLATLAGAAAEAGLTAPALVMVGDIVAMRDELTGSTVADGAP